jgi:hypothetical protein
MVATRRKSSSLLPKGKLKRGQKRVQGSKVKRVHGRKVTKSKPIKKNAKKNKTKSKTPTRAELALVQRHLSNRGIKVKVTPY